MHEKKLLFFLFFFAQVRTFHWQVEFFLFFIFIPQTDNPLSFCVLKMIEVLTRFCLVYASSYQYLGVYEY